MRIQTLLLVGLCLLPPALAEETPADTATTQVPTASPVVVRLPSLDRIDALAKELLPVIKSLAGPDAVAFLETTTASRKLLSEAGVPMELVDRTKPFYFARSGNGMIGLMPAAPGVAFEGLKVLDGSFRAALRNGVVCVGEEAKLTYEARAAATKMLPGDVSVHVYVGELVEANKATIEAGLAQAGGMAMVLPGPAQAVLAPMLDLVRATAYSVESFDYAMSWTGGRIVSEGRVVTKEGSALRKLLARAGAPGDNPLIGFLPREATIVMDVNTTADWPAKEMAEFLKQALGGLGEGIAKAMNANQAVTAAATGRMAMAIELSMMGGGATAVTELKEGTDTLALFNQFNIDAVNETLLKAGVPLKMTLEKAVAKHGETELHRMTMSSDNMQLNMMVGMSQTYMAAEGRYLVSVTGQLGQAEGKIKALLDKVRKGEVAEHPHAKAMARLGRKRNIGISINVAAAKQFGFVFMMAGAPELAQAIGDLPDELYVSTAISIWEGNIHWRGDWPVKEIAKVVEAMRGAAQPRKKVPPKDTDFPD